MKQKSKQPPKRAPSEAPTTWPALVLEAWKLRQAIDRKLLLLAVEVARLERTRDKLDAAFAGQPIPKEE
jgi:hypothetical protein